MSSFSFFKIAGSVTGRFRSPTKVFVWVPVLISLSLIGLAGCADNSVSVRIPAKPLPSAASTSPTVVAPRSTLYLDKAAFIPEGLRFQARTSVFNPGSLNLNVDVLKIALKNVTDKVYAQKDVPGGQISAGSSRSFNFNIDAPIEPYSEDVLLMDLVSEAKSSQTVVPFGSEMRIAVSELKVETLEPQLTLSADVQKLTADRFGLLLETQVDGLLINPNPIRLDFNTIRIFFKDRAGNIISTSTVDGSSAQPGSVYPFSSDWNLPLQIMNEKGFTFYAETWGGIGHSGQAINGSVKVQGPGLKKLILFPEISLKTDAPTWRTDSTGTTMSVNVIATYKNPNWFLMSPGAAHAYIYDSKGTQLSSASLSGADIQASKEGDISGMIYLAATTIGAGGGKFTITVQAEIGIRGINEKIPLTASTAISLMPPHFP